MPNEVVSCGMFWLPAQRRVARVCCRYQVAFEGNHYVYRLLSIQELEPLTA